MQICGYLTHNSPLSPTYDYIIEQRFVFCNRIVNTFFDKFQLFLQRKTDVRDKYEQKEQKRTKRTAVELEAFLRRVMRKLFAYIC